MKTIVIALLTSLFGIAADLPTSVTVPLHRSYIPIGFDDNDNLQITVEGAFPNTCYKVGAASVEVDAPSKIIRIEQKAHHYTGLCFQMLVPFTHTVDLGFVAAGEYAIIDAATGLNLGDLSVAFAKHSGADDYLYAPISDADIQSSPETGHTLVLRGSFSDRCTVFREVRVVYGQAVVVVQPIVDRVPERNCGGKTRFLKTVELKEELKGVYLLHVRSMEGSAINKMIDIP